MGDEGKEGWRRFVVPAGPKPLVLKPGQGGRTRWEVNGYSSKATPLINGSNWNDSLNRWAKQEYIWQGLVDKPPPPGPRDPPKPPPTPKIELPADWHRTRNKVDPSWSHKCCPGRAWAEPGGRKVEQVLFNTSQSAYKGSAAFRLEKARRNMKERMLNDHEAYTSPMPGYTGKRPIVRSPLENLNPDPSVYTVARRDWNGFDVPGVNPLDHKRTRTDWSAYVDQCFIMLGCGSPFLNLTGNDPPARFRMQMCDSEYIKRTAPEIRKIQAIARQRAS